MKFTTIAALTGSLALCGCTTTPSVVPGFDERTGVTWTALNEPIAMAHAVPHVTTAAREYLYVGPLQRNEQGAREEFLWLGFATTAPRLFAADVPSLPDSLLLDVDGLMFELPVEVWEEPVPYDTAATVTHSVTARVSLDQLGLIAGAQSVGIELHHEDGTSVEYDLWSGDWIDWSAFYNAVEPGSEFARSVARN